MILVLSNHDTGLLAFLGAALNSRRGGKPADSQPNSTHRHMLLGLNNVLECFESISN
jgi:hypothetical protein